MSKPQEQHPDVQKNPQTPGAAARTVTLQEAYAASGAAPHIILATPGGVTIRDAVAPAAVCLRVEDNAGGLSFAVNATGIEAGVDILPSADETLSTGTVATSFRRMAARFGYFVAKTGGGTPTIQAADSVYTYTQGGLIAGTAQTRSGSTAELSIYGNFPPIGILGNVYTASVGQTARMYNRGGGSILVGSAFTGATSALNVAEIYAGYYSYGSFTGGYAFASGGAGATAYVRNNASGSFVWGYPAPTAGSQVVESTGTGAGAFVVGRTAGNASHAIRGAGVGSFTQGNCQGNANPSLLSGAGNGTFAQGRANNGGIIQATANGAFAQGQAAAIGCYLQATGVGSFAQGSASQATYLQATQQGAFAQGRVRDAGSYITSSGLGTFAQGYAQNGYGILAGTATGAFAHGAAQNYGIVASGEGAFAVGSDTTALISATAANASQFGPGTNAVADSLQVGTGFQARAAGQHAGVRETITLGVAATTFAVGSQSIEVTGDAGTNTIATITGGIAGQFLALQFVDALVTITDDNTHVADSVDLSAAFTGADDAMLFLYYDGTSWYEVSRSVN